MRFGLRLHQTDGILLFGQELFAPDFGGREVGPDSPLKILFSIAKQRAACYNMTK